MTGERKLLIEPVRRPDGSLLSIYGEDDLVTVSMDTLIGVYTIEDVRLLGQGDFESGILVIGRALFEATDLHISDRVPFSAELDEIHKR